MKKETQTQNIHSYISMGCSSRQQSHHRHIPAPHVQPAGATCYIYISYVATGRAVNVMYHLSLPHRCHARSLRSSLKTQPAHHHTLP
ncbi:hypothetical protein BDZ91DRAFT_732816 [Kalaharituber pfeilii]|nr:hypothetical protein BDZ91DRAFT_732816 [Kalaharituber pfeilii]